MEGGSSAPRLRGATWANAAKDAPGRCLGRISAGWLPGSPRKPRSQLLTRCLSFLQPAPASSGTGSGRVERRCPLLCFQPPSEDDTGVREEGKFPGWKPFLFPSVLDCECARSALPFIPLGRQIAQELEKPQTGAKPQRPPAKSPPPSQSDECVCGQVCEWEGDCA